MHQKWNLVSAAMQELIVEQRNPSSLQEMTHLIRLKEKELHDVHDMRCGQLEKMIEERDTLLLEITKRFEQLKDDFQYNLALLEARDVELTKFEELVKSRDISLSQKEDEVKALSMKLFSVEKRSHEILERQSIDKSSTKVIESLHMFFLFHNEGVVTVSILFSIRKFYKS